MRGWTLWLALVAACAGHRAAQPDPAPMPTAGRPGERIEVRLCPAACENLRRLKCPEGEPTANGQTCEDVCREVETSGTGDLKVDCVVNAANEAALRPCNVMCKH